MRLLSSERSDPNLASQRQVDTTLTGGKRRKGRSLGLVTSQNRSASQHLSEVFDRDLFAIDCEDEIVGPQSGDPIALFGHVNFEIDNSHVDDLIEDSRALVLCFERETKTTSDDGPRENSRKEISHHPVSTRPTESCLPASVSELRLTH